MKEIPLTRGLITLVDDDDFEWLNQYKWYAAPNHNTVYARKAVYNGKNDKTSVPMHRLILNTPKGFETDHIDGDGLNNQKSNLRIVTRRQNLQNQHRKIPKTSKYPGVFWHKGDGAWRAKITINGVMKFLGNFSDEFAAHSAYMIALEGIGEQE